MTRLKIPSLIMTLGAAAIAKGAAFMITQGVAFVGRWPAGFTGLARGTTLGVPHLVLWLAGVTAFAWVLVKWTRARPCWRRARRTRRPHSRVNVDG